MASCTAIYFSVTSATFNTSEYFAPDRRFLLGAVTYYTGPGVWALEIALDVEWVHAIAPGAGILLLNSLRSKAAK